MEQDSLSAIELCAQRAALLGGGCSVQLIDDSRATRMPQHLHHLPLERLHETCTVLHITNRAGVCTQKGPSCAALPANPELPLPWYRLLPHMPQTVLVSSVHQEDNAVFVASSACVSQQPIDLF